MSFLLFWQLGHLPGAEVISNKKKRNSSAFQSLQAVLVPLATGGTMRTRWTKNSNRGHCKKGWNFKRSTVWSMRKQKTNPTCSQCWAAPGILSNPFYWCHTPRSSVVPPKLLVFSHLLGQTFDQNYFLLSIHACVGTHGSHSWLRH